MGFLHVSSLDHNYLTTPILFNRSCEYTRNLPNHNYKLSRHSLYDFNRHLTDYTLHALQNFRCSRAAKFPFFNRFEFGSSFLFYPLLPFCIYIPSCYTAHSLLLFFLQQIRIECVFYICCFYTSIGPRSIFNNLSFYVFYVLRSFTLAILFYSIPLREDT